VVAARAIISEGTAMSSYPYPPGPGKGSGAGTGLSDDALSVTEPGADSAYATSGSTTTGSMTSSADVAGTAKEQAGEVMHEARDQARTLLDRTRREVGDQASSQQQRAAESLRSLSTGLRSMANGQQPEPGMATDLAQQAADRAGQLASWLQDREPGDLLDEVSRFARRRPGVFLALAAGAGVIAGRLTRSMAAGAPSGSGTSAWSGATSGRHMAGTTTVEGSGTRPFTRPTTGGYSTADPLTTGTLGAGTTGTSYGDTDVGAAGTGLPPGNDVTR
jgi:hypothetical protein